MYRVDDMMARQAVVRLTRQNTSFSTLLIFGIMAGVTVFHVVDLCAQNLSYHLTMKNYRWYTRPHECSKSLEELQDMRDLASDMARVLTRLSIPATICYGTLWGVLRHEEILPWDTNVDFCVKKEYLQNISLSELEKEFSSEGVKVEDFSYWKGSYKLQKGRATGFINVFHDCTDSFYRIHSDYENKYPDYLPGPQPERPHWACALSVMSALSTKYYDVNMPFPAWFLEPPFKTAKLRDVNVTIPHDPVVMQKYIYPDDWWTEARPPGC